MRRSASSRAAGRSKAEALFTATQKKDKEVLKEKELAKLAASEKTARLRALRLAKEAADKEAADKAAAEKAQKSTKKSA